MTDNARETGRGETPRPVREQVVIRDKRKIDSSGRVRNPHSAGSGDDGSATSSGANPDAPHVTMGQPTASEAQGSEIVDAMEVVAGEIVTGDERDEKTEGAPGVAPEDGELEALRSELEERLRDLQRVTAEYANYRKRVERDRTAVVEQAVGMVITSLLPILDDFDRAREHDDLVGPLGAVAEQLSAALAKYGLTAFGEAGDAFDPTRHEAVSHATSAEVTEPTCVSVMRRGYLLGDRLLRAALVGVADPE